MTLEEKNALPTQPVKETHWYEDSAVLKLTGTESSPGEKSMLNEVTLLNNKVTDTELTQNMTPFEQKLPESPQFLQSYEAISSEEPHYDSDVDPEYVPNTSSDSGQHVVSILTILSGT